jgi:electron transfer flavoprotein alpha subunit
VYANVMEQCISDVKPTAVLVGATSLGRSLAPACATRFRTGLTADCTVLDMKENTDLVQIRPAFGGNIMAQIITTNSRPQFATVRYKVMDAAVKTTPHGQVVECSVTGEMLTSGIEVVSTTVLEKAKGIEEEDVLVVAGRGVKRQEDLTMLRDLAEALGGQLVTTRPLVEKGWNDVTRQIGLSGRTVKPKLIITCGVSGAVQFAAGMNGAECIVAINTDPEAPIFKIANFCIVKDLYEVVPRLTAAVRAKLG